MFRKCYSQFQEKRRNNNTLLKIWKFPGNSSVQKQPPEEFYDKAVLKKGKPPLWMNEWVLNTLLEGFVQDVPREELVIAPAVEYFTPA